MSTSTIDMADLIGGNSKKKQNKKNEKNNEEKLKETKTEKKLVNKKESDLSEIANKDNDAK
jgi:hypothetical protein